MKNLTSQRIEKRLIVGALIAGVAACGDSVTAPPHGGQSSSPSTVTIYAELTTSVSNAREGEIVWVELSIPSGRLEDGAYEVVLSWDDSKFDYLYSETSDSAVELTAIVGHEATFLFWPDAPEQGKNRVAIAFAAIQDAATSDFQVLSETHLR